MKKYDVYEVVKFDDRIDLLASAAGDYMLDGKLDIGLYVEGPLSWDDLYIEFNDWLYLYDAYRGKWYNLPGPYMIDDLQTVAIMLEQTITTGQPLECYEVDDEDILKELNEQLNY